MDYKQLSFWFSVGQWAFTLTLGIFVWVNARQAAARVVTDDHEKRLTSMEARAQLMPDHDDLSKLYERVNAVSKEMSAVKGELKHMNNTLKLINSYLINKGPSG